MAETPENKQQNEGATAPTPLSKATLSEKAEKLAARLEEHKNQQPKPTETTRPAAAQPDAAQSAPAQPAKSADAAPKTAVQPTTVKKPAAASTKPVSKVEPATEPVDDIIRAIKLPHEIAAEKKQQPADSNDTAAGASSGATAVPPVMVDAPSSNEKSSASAAAVAEARSRVFGNYVPEPEPSEAAMKRRVARERALTSKPPLARTAQVLLAVIFPVLTLIAAVRLVATPLFLALAYGRPGFPADAYGFSWAERLTYASYGVDYLNNFAGPEYLGGLRLPDGQALFTQGEVQHMVDVKNLIGVVYVIGAVLAVLAIVLIAYLARRYAGGVRRGLFAGALATLGLIAVLAVAAILGWESFFTTFHQLFFNAGTWTFYATDSLIRLYPEQFWIDSALTIAALVLVTVVVVLVTCWPTGRRREASRLRQEARVFGLGTH